MQARSADRVDDESVRQTAGACRARSGGQQESVLFGEVGLPLPLVVGPVVDGWIVAHMHVVGGDGGAARLGGVEHLPHFGMAGSVRILHVLQDDVALGLVDSGEQFDALELDRLMGFGHVLAGDAVVAEHAVRRTGQVRHLGDMHGRRGREGRAGHVDRGGGRVHAGLGDDLAVCRRRAGRIVSTVGARADGNVGAEVDACRVGGLDQRAGHVGFGLDDVDLTGTVEVAAQVAFDVLGCVFEHVHELRVERVG